MGLPISIQLFTVRNAMKADYISTLKAIKAMGYDAVEWAGYPASAAELKKLIDDLGLVSSGSHVGFDPLKDTAQVIDEAKTLGHEFVIVPWADVTDVAKTEGEIAKLNAAVPALKAAGLQLCFHNHDRELKVLENGKTPIQMMAEQSPELAFEFDMGWVWVGLGGQDPTAYAAGYAGRVPLLHIKDFIAPASDRKMCEMGSGVIDYQPVVDAAEGWGVQYLVTEQDTNWIDGDAMKSSKINHDVLRAMVQGQAVGR